MGSTVNGEVKRLGIMQPYFFPYPGYFSLIKATNKWIVFDTPQYVSRSWMNRNRILDPNSGSWMYMTIPVKKHPLNHPLNSIEIQSAINWKEKIMAQLGYYKKRAPYYQTVVSFLKETLSTNFRTLSELNIHTLIATSAHLGIDFNYEIFSEIETKVKTAQESDEWGLNICKALGVTDYINAEGGLKFMNKEKFIQNNINIHFLRFGHPYYNQKRDDFIPDLSIIDAMMFNSPEEIRKMLDAIELVK